MEHTSKKSKLSNSIDFKLGKDKCAILTKGYFLEPINRTLLQRVINSGLLTITYVPGERYHDYRCAEKTHLMKLAKRLKDGVLKVKYVKPKLGYGRVQAKGCLSLGSLRKPVRHTLCENQWVDLDISNCHPELLLQLAQSHGEQCDALFHYCKNRADSLQQVAKIFKDGLTEETRDAAKCLFIAMMNGGSPNTFLKKHADALVNGCKLPEIIQSFRRDSVHLSRWLQTGNPGLVQALEKKEGGRGFNFDGKFMAHYLQHMERLVLEVMFTHLGKTDFVQGQTCVLCYDGIMLRKDALGDTSVEAVCKSLETVILDTLGFKLKITEKIMTKSLLPQIEEIERARVSFEIPKESLYEFDYVFMSSLWCYSQQKIYFERFFAQVLNSMGFVKVSQYCERGKKMVVEIRDIQKVKLVEECASFFTMWNGEQTTFLTRWFADPSKRLYYRDDWVPYNDVYQWDNGMESKVFNRFTGFDFRIKTPLSNESAEAKAAMTKSFHSLGLQLCGANESLYEFLLDCLALRIQKPDAKIRFCWILMGDQGVGKGSFFGALKAIVGSKHFYETANPEDLFGKHAEGLVRKQIVVLNETEGKDTKDLQGRIKAATSDTSMTVNRKFQRPTKEENLSMLFIVTNKPNPVNIDVVTKDRRFVLAKSTNQFLEKKYDDKYWASLHKHFAKPSFVRCLYDELNERDISNVDFIAKRKKNLTKEYWDMCEQFVPIEAMYFADLFHMLRREIPSSDATHGSFIPAAFIPDYGMENSEQKVQHNNLYKVYCAWSKHRGFYPKAAPNAKQFKSRLLSLKLPIQFQAKSNGYPCWKFVPVDMFKHLQDCKWAGSMDVGDNLEEVEIVQGFSNEELNNEFPEL
jgi:hypothetical protein